MILDILTPNTAVDKMEAITTVNFPTYPLVKLPYPFLTTYRVQVVADTTPAKLALIWEYQPVEGRSLPQSLHSASFTWLDLAFPSKKDCPPQSDNSPWARARRAPATTFQWTSTEPPTLSQVWNVVHALYLGHPTNEYFRLTLLGDGRDTVKNELLATGLGIAHPQPRQQSQLSDASLPSSSFEEELLILRSSFWQGAASPTDPRPIWVVGDATNRHLRTSLSQFTIWPENYQLTNKFPHEPVYTRHPIRKPKPHPGSIVYSRYIPEVDQHFSLEAVDWQDPEHLKLFNKWQNDPRVAQGWNETGTLEQHQAYLRKLHNDPHVLCLFGCFDQTRFAYFELYWAKVSCPPPPFSSTNVVLSFSLYCLVQS